MGTGLSRQNRKNELQPSQALSSQNPGNTATQHGYVTDALPMDHSHGMQAMSSHGMQAMSNSSPDGTAPSSGPVPGMTRKEFESVAYNMSHDNRGKAIIINNKTFQPHLKLSVRSGTDADGNALHSTFNAMGFDVKVHNDKTVQEMMTILSDASKEYDYHRNSDCFICAILTHGEEQDVLYGTDDKADFENILSFFKGKNCPGLVGKPKLFFIQACQGNKVDQGVALDVTDSKAVAPREISIQKIPIEADILRAHSSVPDFRKAFDMVDHEILLKKLNIYQCDESTVRWFTSYLSYAAWRHEKNGSFFIQALTEILSKNWKKMDLLTMLTRVNQMVALKIATKEMQIPMFTSTLTKDVFFTPKEL